MTALLTALIAGATSVVVAWLTSSLTTRRERAGRQTAERERVAISYLNPLRYYLAENYLRLNRIRLEVGESGRAPALVRIESPSELSGKDPSWFVREGAYLTSAAYLTACLFATIVKLRRDLPFMHLTERDDTLLLAKCRRVGIAFRLELGIFYTLQDSIGHDMIRGERVATYREFALSLQDESQRVWFDRLINFYTDLGK